MSTICVSGSFLSSLLFKLKNAPGDAEGFLLGKVCSHQVDHITDSQSSGRKEERKICLHSFVNFNKKRSFYSASSCPDVDKIQQLLGDRFKDVIGWFSYRRNSSHRLSMMEKILHRKLAHSFKHLQSKDFIVAVITDEIVEVSTVFSTEYSFQCWDGRPYQLLPTRVLPPHLIHYGDVLVEQRSSFITAEGEVGHCKEVERLCVALLNKFTPLEEELITTSEQVRNASKEVTELKAAVTLAQKEKMENLHDDDENSKHLDEPVGVVSGGVSTAILVDIDNGTVPCDDDDDENSKLLDEPVGVVSGGTNTAILINIDNGTMSSHDEPCDQQSHTIPPSLDVLSAGVGLLVPERLSTQHENSQQHCISQELF